MTTPPAGYLSVNDAAVKLGVKPWEVVRLTESGRIESVILVDAASLRHYAQEQK